jgi:uncharacterized protein (DUF2132 family)
MTDTQPNNPLHGLTLAPGVRININCFKSDPSVKSSLKFLRKTPWAREKVECLYLSTFCQ